MLRYEVHGVLLTFAFLALIPFPLVLIMGIMVLIIWHYHKRDILAGKRQTTFYSHSDARLKDQLLSSLNGAQS